MQWLSTLWLDLRFAARTSSRRPGLTAIAVLTIALGIGGATAVFSVVNAVLLRPLPYHDPGRLTAVWITSTREAGLAKLFATYQDYREFRAHSHRFEEISVATWAKSPSRVLSGRGRARAILVIPASLSFFDTLGVHATLGRTFRPDDQSRGCSIVLSHRFWISTLASDRAIVGQSLTLDDQSCTVLGVMPADFSFYPPVADAWSLLGPDTPDSLLAGIFARLRPGVTAPQAEAELRGLYRPLHPAAAERDFEPIVNDLRGEFTFLAGRTLRTTLLLVFGAVLLVLLIACLNVANLLLARFAERRRELAVRAALGSGQPRLIRQLLTEGLLLSMLGTAFGTALAAAAIGWFRHASPIELTVGADVALSLPVLLFSGLLTVASTLVFALFPAFRTSGIDLVEGLKAAGRGAVPGRKTAARSMLAVEMALSFLLLTGAGFLIASALRMGTEPLGFSPDRLIASRVALPSARYPADSDRLLYYHRLLARLEQMPGIAGVALTSKVPPEAGGNQTLEVLGRPVSEATAAHNVGADAVSPRFFDVLGIPLLRGRAFSAQDRAGSASVAIINQSLARAYFPHSDPIGQRIRIPGGNMPWLTIVGIVGDLKHTELMNEMAWVATPIFYRPLAQEPRPSIQIVARAIADPGATATELTRQTAFIDPSLVIPEADLVSTRLSKLLAYPRFRAVLLGFFALAAILLSAVGLHGVLSQLVAQRTPELGLRRAVGAQTGDLLWLILREGGAPVMAGLVIGVLMAILLQRVLANLLYGIRSADPAMLAAVAIVLVAVAAPAILLPAWRAAQVDPMSALRDE